MAVQASSDGLRPLVCEMGLQEWVFPGLFLLKPPASPPWRKPNAGDFISAGTFGMLR